MDQTEAHARNVEQLSTAYHELKAENESLRAELEEEKNRHKSTASYARGFQKDCAEMHEQLKRVQELLNGWIRIATDDLRKGGMTQPERQQLRTQLDIYKDIKCCIQGGEK